jgi:hypothetical protein
MAQKKLTSGAGTPATKHSAGDRREDRREELVSQIVEIAEGLDDDGLELLLEQAKTVEYKGKIEQFNRRLNVAAREAVEARHAASRPDYYVAIERTPEDFFIIQLDDQRIFFNLQELRELTRICHKAKDEKAGARNLFRWFERERSDLLADANVNSARSPYLVNLYDTIVSTYKVKE